MAEATQGNPYYQTGLTTKQWYLMDKKLRHRWWHETDFGRKEPSAELRQAIKDAEIYCLYCKKVHAGGATCMGHFP